MWLIERCWRTCFMVGGLFLFMCFSACRRDMQDQPKYQVYEPSQFFNDQAASRPIPEHTVPRGFLREDDAFFTGRLAKGTQAPSGPQLFQTSAAPQPSPAAANAANVANAGNAGNTNAAQFDADLVTTIPFTVTPAALDRGQDQFQTYCAMCHSLTGEGDGMIVRRGYKKPPSYHEERLRRAPVGHFFDVITNGWGSMPSYSYLVQPRDRWLIVAYIRALQLSRSARMEELPEAERQRIAQSMSQPPASPTPTPTPAERRSTQP